MALARLGLAVQRYVTGVGGVAGTGQLGGLGGGNCGCDWVGEGEVCLAWAKKRRKGCDVAEGIVGSERRRGGEQTACREKRKSIEKSPDHIEQDRLNVIARESAY